MRNGRNEGETHAEEDAVCPVQKENHINVPTITTTCYPPTTTTTNADIMTFNRVKIQCEMMIPSYKMR